MGVFVYSESVDATPLERLKRLYPRFGFQLQLDVPVGTGRLLAFNRLNGSGIHVLRSDQNQEVTAVCAGSFFYGSADVIASLRAFLADRSAGRVDWKTVHGHFNLILISDAGPEFYADLLGTRPTYYNENGQAVSNSFLATCLLAPRLTIRRSAVERYLAFGYTYDNTTFFDEVRRVPTATYAARRDRRLDLEPITPSFRGDDFTGATLDEVAAELIVPLKRYMSWVVARSQGKLRVAMSSGFDSRLTLALIQDAGGHPILETYTDSEPWEAPLVRNIAQGEGLVQEIIGGEERTRGHKHVLPFTEPELFERNFVSEDGWSPTGMFDDGVAYYDRMERSARETVLHGGAGEVYRNYLYLFDGPYTASDLTYFYADSDWRPWMKAHADRAALFSGLASTISESIGGDSDAPLTRAQVEETYLYHRGRYFFGHQVDVNQRVGEMIFFFIDAANSWLAHKAPLQMKNFGRLQARMIRQLNPRLAQYPSSYGFDFASGPSIQYIAKSYGTYARPIWLRRLLAQRRGRANATHANFAQTVKAYRGVLDDRFPYVSGLFDTRLINTRQDIDRAASLEYLFQYLNVQDAKS